MEEGMDIVPTSARDEAESGRLAEADESRRYDGPQLIEQSWRAVLRERLQGLNWPRVADDVRPLLIPGANPEMFTLDSLERALAKAT